MCFHVTVCLVFPPAVRLTLLAIIPEGSSLPRLVGMWRYTEDHNTPGLFPNTLQLRSRLPNLGGDHSETKASGAFISSISGSSGGREQSVSI